MRTVRRLPTLLVFAVLAGPLAADDASWTLRPSASARVGYDDNVFLQDGGAPAPGVTGAVPARAGSWFTRVSAGIDASWKPSAAFQLDASYSPELVAYEAFSDENHADQKIDLGLRGRTGAWSHQFKANAVFVDGEDESPIYGYVGGGPAIGGAPVRSRRDQLNTKASGWLRRDFDGVFVRATGDFVSNDYGTRHVNTAAVPGYSNYVDRSEWTVGADVGRDVAKNLSLFAGARVGEQHQDNLLGVAHNYSNQLTRLLVGIEGKPRADLTLRLLGGPDHRRYGREVAAGFDRSRATRYIEASATWNATKADTITLAGKDYLWLSASGRCAYQHTTAGLQWKHVFDADWSASLAAETQAGDSRDYSAAATNRLDWIHAGTLTVTRSLGADTKLDLEVVHERGESAIDAKPGRDYTHWLVSAGVRHVF